MAGFPQSGSGEFQCAESAYAERREALGAPFGKRVGGLFYRRRRVQQRCFSHRGSGIRLAQAALNLARLSRLQDKVAKFDLARQEIVLWLDVLKSIANP